jgi:hypothetical protein
MTMKTITHVAAYVDLFARLRSGISNQFKWNPEDTTKASEEEIRRRVRFLLDHVSDSAARADDRWRMLETWALADGCVTAADIARTAKAHGRVTA